MGDGRHVKRLAYKKTCKKPKEFVTFDEEKDVLMILEDTDETITVGQLLKKARTQKKLELSSVAQSLCIRKFYLEKIEQDQLESLPGDMYAVGFIRSYARHVGLDDGALVEKLKNQSAHVLERPSLVMPTPLPEVGVPTIKLAIVATGVALFVLLVTTQFSLKDIVGEKGVSIAMLEDVKVATPVVAITDSDAVKAAPNMLADASVVLENPISAPLAVQPLVQAEMRNVSDVPIEKPIEKQVISTPTRPLSQDIILKATDMSWVEIKDPTGQAVFHKVMQQGDTFALPRDGTLQLHSGNAGGLVFSRGDQDSHPLGHAGEVIKEIPLSTQKILADYF